MNIQHHILPRQFGKSKRIIELAKSSEADIVLIVSPNTKMSDHTKRKFGAFNKHKFYFMNYKEVVELMEKALPRRKRKYEEFLTVDLNNNQKIDIFVDELHLAAIQHSEEVMLHSLFKEFVKTAVEPHDLRLIAFSTPAKSYSVLDYVAWCKGVQVDEARELEAAMFHPEYLVTKHVMYHNEKMPTPTEQMEMFGARAFKQQVFAELFTLNTAN